MTSSAQHDDWFLAALRRAGDEDCPALGAGRQYDIAEARRMSPGERLAGLDEIMRLIESAGIPSRVEEPVRCGDLRL